jgi:iron complex outermembrane receptor protein
MKAFLFATTCLAGLGGAATSADAQDQSTSPVTAQSQQSGMPAGNVAESANGTGPVAGQGLQEIIVTAQRRSENLQRAAVPVSAVTGDMLRDAGISRPTELTAVVPALQVATSSGPYTLFYLRGVGNFNGNALSDSAVAFNFNGVYIGRPSSTTGFFYDLDRVEVVKGPQGTLYGRNATGGAINVIAHAPVLNEFSGSAVGEYGNYNAVRIDGEINLPVGDNAAIRAAGIYVKHDGYMNDGTDDQKDKGGRLSFKWQPTSNLTATIFGDYFHQGGKGPGSTAIALGVDNRYGLLSPQGQAYYSTQPVSVAGRNFNGIDANPFLDNEVYGVSGTIEWRTSIGTITIVPAYREANINYDSTTAGFQIRQREHDQQTSFEARLASNENHKLRYLFGIFYYDETNNVPLYNVDSQYNASYQNYAAHTQSMATFGRLTYAITDNIRFNVGGRFTTEDKSFTGTYFSLNRLCINFPAFTTTHTVQITGPCTGAAPFPYSALTPPAATIPLNPANPYVGLNEIYGATAIFQTASPINADRSAGFEKATWRAGAEWDITPRNLLYASYETGFKSGGFFFSADSGVYQPETIRAWTIGSKNRFLDNKLQINLEAFYWKYSNQQISHLGQDSLGDIIFATENVGKADFKGVEVDAQFLATRNTLLTADVQYLDATYKDFVYSVPLQGPPPANGCRLAGATATQYQFNCAGLRPPNAPKWTINMGAQQTVPLGHSGKIVFNGRAHWQSETLTGLEFLPIEEQGAYWQVDASVTYSAPGDKFFLSGFVNNLTNTTVIGNTFPPPLSGFVVGSLRPPRTFGVRAGFRF